MGFQEDLDSLVKRAKELGACEAVWLPTTKIVVDPRVRFKCLVPRCPHYDQNLMCPPRLPSVHEFKEILARYHQALFFQMRIPLTQAEFQKNYGEKELAILFTLPSYHEQVTANRQKWYALLDKLEALAFKRGYPFAAALSIGPCYRCPECLPQGPCRQPFRARPSMEALGIDVLKTARNIGLSLSFTQGEACSNGLLLLD